MEGGASLQRGLAALGLEIDPAQQEGLLSYLDELLRWNLTINLTAIRSREEGVEKHLLDALTLVPLLNGSEGLLDIGSGAGLPGIPLKVVLPGLRLVSVEAVAKKVMFQRHVLRRLGIEGQVEHARVESLADREEYRKSFEVITARAFSSLETLLTLAAPFLKPGGRVIAMKGPEGEREWRECVAVQDIWRCTGVERVKLPFSAGQRQLLILEPLA